MFIVTHRQNMCKLKKLYLCLNKYKQNHRTLAKAREPSDLGDSKRTTGHWRQHANHRTLVTASELSDFGVSNHRVWSRPSAFALTTIL